MRRLLPSLLVLALVAAACAGADDEPATPTAPATTLPPPPAGVLRIGVDPALRLDPLAADPERPEELLVADLLADGLVAADLETGVVVPRLAARWNVSASRTRWSFRIDEAATFVDGTPVRAADIVATVERARSGGGALAQRLAVIDEVVDGGPTLVHVDLVEPDEDLLSLLAIPQLGIVPADAAERDPRPVTRDEADGGEAAGQDGLWLAAGETSGPYRLVVDAEGLGDVVLHTVEAGPGVPEVRLLPVADGDAAVEALLAGAVDLARVPAVVGEAAEDVDRGFGVLDPGAVTTLYLAFNVGEERLADGDLRRAVAQTVDRGQIAEDLGVGAVPQRSLVPVGARGGGDPCGDPCETDVEAAMHTFEEVGPAFGLQLLVATPDRPDAKEVADDVVSGLVEAGVGGAVEVLDPEEYADAVAEGQVGVFLHVATALPPVPGAVLAALFDSDSPTNPTGWDDGATDDAIADARAEQDPEARSAAWAALERDLAREAVLIPLVALPAQIGLSGRVDGVVVRPDGLLDLTAATAG